VDAIRELRRALQSSNPDDHVIAPLVAQYGDVVARQLAVDREELAEFDEASPFDRGRLISLVERAHAHRKWERDRVRARKLELALIDLQSSARTSHGAVHLSVAALFRVNVNASRALLGFEFRGRVVHVRRTLLKKTRRALRYRGDVWAFLDEHGLHLRWRGGRGGLDLRAAAPGSRERPAYVVRLDPPLALPPAQLGDVLRSLASP